MSFADIDLNETVRAAIDQLKLQVITRRAEVSIPRPFPSVYCDFVRTGEVFFNLILNAIKYNTHARPLIEVGYTDDHPRAYYVKDNGIGIPSQHHETIFGIFTRLHGQDEFGGGSGSGLAIAKRIVERHHGKIWVESEPDLGSKFLFTLSSEVKGNG